MFKINFKINFNSMKYSNSLLIHKSSQMHRCIYVSLVFYSSSYSTYLINFSLFIATVNIFLLVLIKLKIYGKTALPDFNTDCYIKLYFPFIYFAGK